MFGIKKEKNELSEKERIDKNIEEGDLQEGKYFAFFDSDNVRLSVLDALYERGWEFICSDSSWGICIFKKRKL